MRVLSKAKYFAQIGYQPHSGQVPFHKSNKRFRIPVCGRRFGKDVFISTPVATTDGWTTMGALQPGVYVFGPDGEPTEVVTKSEVMYNTCYEVTFDDGASIIAGGSHEWAVETYTMRKSRGNGRWKVPPYKVMTTAQLASRVGKVKYPDSIMLSQPIQLPVQKLDIDPYVLGVWLGDGSTGTRYFACHDEDAPTYQEYFERAGYPIRKTNRPYVWYIANFPTKLQKTGIADAYRMGSVEQRLALLQGLMDTDGTLSNEQIQFDNSNKELVELVQWLVNSLGGKGRVSQHEPYYKNEADERVYGKTSYRFGYNIALPVFRLQRKLDKQMRLKQGPQTVRRYIKAVRCVATVPTQCIQVARTDGLWLAGAELIVTHNSVMAGRDLEPHLFQQRKRYWIIGPSYELGEKEFRVVWNDLIIDKQFGKHKGVKKAYNKRVGQMYIELPWQTRLEVRSAKYPDDLVGDALDGVIMSEAAKHTLETWERFVQPALSDTLGWATFPTTPEGFNWIYDLWGWGQDASPEYRDYDSWRLPSWLNIIRYPGGFEDTEIQRLKATQRPEWFAQEIGAEFSSFVGKIYPDWDEDASCRNITYNPEWPNYIAFDWGFTNPLAAIEFQVDPWDNIWIWREHYKAYTILHEHLKILKSRPQPPGYKITLCFGDAADPGAIATVSRLFAPCVGDAAAKTDWRQGVELVTQFLKKYPRNTVLKDIVNQDDQGIDQALREALLQFAALRREGAATQSDGLLLLDEFGTPAPDEPKLFVDYSCKHTRHEFNNYRAPKGARGSTVPETGDKNHHILDALRYGLMHLYVLGAAHHLTEIYDLVGEAPSYEALQEAGFAIPTQQLTTVNPAAMNPAASPQQQQQMVQLMVGDNGARGFFTFGSGDVFGGDPYNSDEYGGGSRWERQF